VRVGDAIQGNDRLWIETNDFPKATADFSENGVNPTVVMDGIKSYAASGSGKNRWSNYQGDRTGDTPVTPQETKLSFITGLANETPYNFNKITVYWYVRSSDGMPNERFVINYMNEAGEMVPVENQQATEVLPAPSNGRTFEYTFDNVYTSRIDFDMKKSSGVIAITEVEMFERLVNQYSDNVLSDLRVNGETVADFDPAVRTYTVSIEDGVFPEITAAAESNPGVTIIPASVTNPIARVIVKSENHNSTNTYTITFDMQEPAFGFAAIDVLAGGISYQLEGYQAFSDAQIIVALYDGDGRLVGVSVDPDGLFDTFTPGEYSICAFAWDQDFMPLTDKVTETVNIK
jgi:hypothetical protein